MSDVVSLGSPGVTEDSHLHTLTHDPSLLHDYVPNEYVNR